MTIIEDKPSRAGLYRLGKITFHPQRRIIQTQTARTVIEPRMADVLSRLIANRGPVTRHDLLDDVWGEDGSDEALTQVVSRLRRAIGDVERPYKIILTVPRGGYELGLAPEPIEAMPALAVSDSDAAKPSWLSQNKQLLIGFAVGIFTSLLILTLWLVTHPAIQIEKEIRCYPGSADSECQTLSDGI